MASVFLSHSSRDGPVVDAIAAFLRNDEHHSVFLDHHPDEGIQVGERWEQVLYERLHAADVVVCVVTENHVASRWCFAEVALAKALGRHVLPIRAQAGVRHPLLESVQAVDYLRDPVGARSSLRDRLRAIEAGGGAAWDPSRPLFPGLASFDTSDAPVFFGREIETDKLASLVRSRTTQRASRAVVVVGGSGSGKSSLVRAGLVPRLVAEGWWAVPPVLPGPDPLRALCFAVARAWKLLEPERRIDMGVLSRRLIEDIEGVATELLLAAPGPGSGLLLVIDQFEEAFTRAAGGSAAPFLAVLDQAAEAGRSTAVVATMRSEFLGELLACEPAGRLRESHFPLAPLSRARLASIVKGPARKGRLDLSDDLVQRLVEDTGSGEALPLLAYVLRLLTEHSRPGDRIDVDQYEKIQGVQGALRIQADEALARAVVVTGRSEEEILDGFVGLVSLDAAGTPTRRRVARSAVPSHLLDAFEVFVDARLVSSDDVGGEPQLAASHEALFTAWPQLSAAIESHAEHLRLRRRLEQAAAEWEQAGREPSILWRGEQLRRARAALVDTDGWSEQERRFVEEGSAADADVRRREADIVADRIRASGLVERDSELALLLLLVAADEYAPTDSVIGGLRQTLARHRIIGRIPRPDARVTALAVSDDGHAVAAGDLGTNVPVTPSTRPQALPPAARCRVSVWEAETLELIQTLWFEGRQIGGLDLCSEPELRLAVGVDDRVVVADVTTGATITEGISVGSTIRSVALSHRGDRVVAQAVDRTVVAIDVTSGHQEVVAFVHGVDAPAESSTASRVRPHFDEANDTVVLNDDVWPEAFRTAGWISPPSSSLSVWSTRARRVVSMDQYGLEVRQVEPVDCPLPIGQVDGQVAVLRWRANAQRIAVTTDGRFIDLSTAVTPEPLGTVHAVSGDCTHALLDEPPRIHEFASGKERRIEANGVRSAGFSQDGRWLAVATWGSLSVFDVRTGQLVARFGEHSDPEGDVYEGVGLSQDGTRLVTTSLGGGRAHIWDIATGQPLKPVPHALDLSPDGADVVARGFREIAADLSSGVEVRLRASPVDVVATVAPDRRTLLAIPLGGSGPGTGLVMEYTLPEGHPLFVDTTPCVAATFSADAMHLLFARADGTIEVSPQRAAAHVLERARRHVYRTITREDRASFDLPSGPGGPSPMADG